MGTIIGILGFISSIICIILLIVKIIKRKSVKKIGLAILVSFALFVIGVVITPTPVESEINEPNIIVSSNVDDVISKMSPEKVPSEVKEVEVKPVEPTAMIESSSTLLSDLEVHFIDVGQGDSILIISPNGSVMLVDGGSIDAGQKVVNYLKKVGISSINKVVATHPNEDHIGGLNAVLDNFTVEKVYDSGYAHTTQTFESFINKIDQKNIEFEIVKRGSNINLDPALKIDVLSPYLKPESPNAASIVLKITYKETSLLLTADTEDFAEFNMIDNGIDLKADIMQVAHHGSDTSSSGAFLDAVNPETAVISVGTSNSYGHPVSSVLNALSSRSIDVYRTDMQGDIVIKSNGSQYTLNVIADVKTVAVNKASSQTNTTLDKEQPLVQSITYIGNLNSKVFHLPSCKTLPLEKNRIYFDTREKAVGAGYRSCGNCKP